jgi:transposase-like protein
MKTHYSVEYKLQVLLALDANNGNIYQTAKEFDIPRMTISDWNQRREHLFEQGELLMQQRRLRLAQRMEMIVNQIVDGLPKKVASARLSDSANALRILLNLSAEVEAKNAQRREKKTDIREKLTRLLDHYAAQRAAEEGAPITADEDGASRFGRTENEL